MKRITHTKNFMRIAGIFLLAIGFTSCSDDDINVFVNDTEGIPTGIILIDDWQSLSGNVLTVPSVKVGQDSWLTAVAEGEETLNNFIAQPVMIEEGTTTNVQLTFEETVIYDIDNGHQVVLKLYADNLNGGTIGEWDTSDEPIKLANNELMVRTITLYPDFSTFNWFAYYDSNGDGFLTANEILRTYPNAFDFYDKDHLTPDEFYFMMFLSTNTNYYDDGITEAEWKDAHLRMFHNWAEDNFPNYDKDGNEFLDYEEWQEIFEESGWFENYDTNSNNLLTEEELNKGYFSDWDLNNDGIIDNDEFNHYRRFTSHIGFQEAFW